MNLTLRKANAVQASINEVLKSLEFKVEIGINEFQDPEAEIAKAHQVVKENMVRRIDLLDALYEIRKAVSAANFEKSVDSRLADIARLEKDIQFFGQYVSTKVRQTPTVLTGKLDKLRNRKEDVYSYRDNSAVDTSVFTEQDIDRFKTILAGAKKAKQKLQDDLLEINVRTDISLSDECADILVKEGIL